jgi:hypothetical protein
MLAGGLDICDTGIALARRPLACIVIPDFLTQLQTISAVNLFFPALFNQMHSDL